MQKGRELAPVSGFHKLPLAVQMDILKYVNLAKQLRSEPCMLCQSSPSHN